MKKILLSLLAICLLSIENVKAAEVDLDVTPGTVDWGAPWTDAAVNSSAFAAFEVGQKLHFYLELAGSDYHQYRFDTASWNLLPGQMKTDIASDTKVTIVVTQTIKNAVAAQGFELHGHGFMVTKVTKEESDLIDMEDKVIKDWGYDPSEKSDYYNGKWAGSPWYTLKSKVTSPCNLYILVEKGDGIVSDDLRISGGAAGVGYGDGAYPSDGYNHMQNLGVDNIVTVAITQDFINAALGVEDGYVAFWGSGGFTIKGIATSKEALITKVPVTLGSNGYTTFSYPWALELGKTDVTAYTATLTSNTLAFVANENTVAKETGLLLEGNEDATYYIPVTTDAGSAVAGNALKPAVKDVELQSDPSGNYYFVMQKNSDPLAFKAIPTASLIKLPDCKAYVEVAAGEFTAHELNVSFDNETTAISAVKDVTKADNRYYNLSGQVVANPTKGIYILNGKKVVIK